MKQIKHYLKSIIQFIKSNFFSGLRLHLLLFLLTLITASAAGAKLAGYSIFEDSSNIVYGLSFSIPLLIILGAHEMGHYLACRKYHIDATLPFFIPDLSFFFLIGTFGAVIKIKEPVQSRKVLLRIAVMGPYLSFVLSAFFFWYGIKNADLIRLSDYSETHEYVLKFGDSLLTYLITKLYYPNLGSDLTANINNVGFAGWVGFLVTSLNLIPAAQLDGGHVTYVLFPKQHRKISILVSILLIFLSYFWLGWILWSFIIAFILYRTKRSRIYINEDSSLSFKDYVLIAAAYIILILTFIPVPLEILEI